MKLHDTPQWTCWRYQKREKSITKIPVGPTGKIISITNPKCFMSFDQALRAWSNNGDKIEGIGFIFTEEDNFTGIDLDSIDKWNGSGQIVDLARSYTERSPSGEGLHIICEGHLEGEKHGIKVGNHAEGEIAIYDSGRFFTVTHDLIDDEWIHEDAWPVQDFLDWLCGSLDDKALVNRVLADADVAPRFQALWKGEWRDLKDPLYSSQSEADFAFCRILANKSNLVYRGIKMPAMHQVDRIFKQTKLMRPKWMEKRGNSNYGYNTLEKAIFTN